MKRFRNLFYSLFKIFLLVLNTACKKKVLREEKEEKTNVFFDFLTKTREHILSSLTGAITIY